MGETEIRYTITRNLYKKIKFKYIMKNFCETNLTKMFVIKFIELVVIITVFSLNKKLLEIVGMDATGRIILDFITVMMIIAVFFVLFQELIVSFIWMAKFKCRFVKLVPKEGMEITLSLNPNEIILNHPKVHQKIPWGKVYKTGDVLYLAGGLLPLESIQFSVEDWDKLMIFCQYNNIL